MLLYPVVLFILARLLFPFGFSEGVIDLKKFYFENYRRIFLFIVILAVLSIVDNLLIRDYVLVDLVGPMVVLILLSTMALIKNSKPWLHQSVAIFMFLLLVISIAVEWDKWLVMN